MGVKQGRQEVTGGGPGAPGVSTGLAAMEQVRLSTCKAQSKAVGGARAWEPTQPSCTLGQEAWLPDSWTGPAPRRAGTDPGAPVRSQYPTTHWVKSPPLGHENVAFM